MAKRNITVQTFLLILGILAIAATPALLGQEKSWKVDKTDRDAPIPEAVFIPTPYDVVDEMLKLADVHKSDFVYDLGCGDGRIVIAAAKQYGCRAVGIDIDPRRVKQSMANVANNKMESLVAIRQQDALEADLRPATVVTLYLASQLNRKLIPQLDKLKPGSRIISHQFDMPGVEPDKIIHVKSSDDNRRTHTLYLWTTPLKKRT